MDNIKVYGVDVDIFYKEYSHHKLIDNLTNEEFIEESEKQGLVWSLKGFQDAFNYAEIDNEYIYIRIIEN